MSHHRWQRLNELFQAALDKELADRAGYLDQACAGDSDLRRDLESLLAAHERAGAFMDDPVFSTGSVEAADMAQATLPAGRRLGPYEIVALLATGGMGEVYRARDLRLGREVAVKVLPTSSLQDGSRLRRFHQEARAVGALNHPNILAVYDVGMEGSVPYVVCELLEGETLRGRLQRPQPLSAAEALEYARQIAAGLAAAHEKGIVHRDLKPANVFITADRRLKILDFGLAKQTLPGPRDTTVHTQPGMLMGTVGYMSPEQVRGEPADQRSDTFSFGALLYEMLGGGRAFGGGSAVESLHAILHEQPDLTRLMADLPAAVETIVERCLEKDRDRRFPTGRELLAALEAASHDLASGEPPPPRQRTLAVLPFRNLVGDAESAHLGVGLADATITELASLRALIVRPTSAILRYQDRSTDPVQAARELAVDAVVDGSFQRAGARLRVTVQLVGADGRALWASKLDTSLEDLFRMQDEVSRSIAHALEVRLEEGETRRRQRRVAQPAPGAEAYELYLKGKVHLLRESLGDCVAAVDWFEKARSVEPDFALAWAGLADAYGRIAFEFQPEGDWYDRAQAACAKALSLDPRLPEGRYVRGRLLWSPQGGFDHARAMRELAAAIAGRPNLDDAYVRLGVLLFHVGLIEDAEAQLERALAISPMHVIGRGHIASCRYHAGRYQEALELAQWAAQRNRSYWHHYTIAHSHLRLDRVDEAARVADRMAHLGEEGVSHAHAVHGLIAALAGDREQAHRSIDLATETKKAFGHYHHDQYDIACIHALLGEREEALRWLANAARNGYPCHPFFERDPLLASIRDDGRFVSLMDELKAESADYACLWAELAAGSGESTLRSLGT